MKNSRKEWNLSKNGLDSFAFENSNSGFCRNGRKWNQIFRLGVSTAETCLMRKNNKFDETCLGNSGVMVL
ncbi:hypothetical protein HanIR_Chr01g0038251 [Helianthus annuus]|nr:hypothetical protein HanIR_Chr01g0038251 [Helianthus annuus]